MEVNLNTAVIHQYTIVIYFGIYTLENVDTAVKYSGVLFLLGHFNNFGPKGHCYKTFHHCNLLPICGIIVILCYKIILLE